MCSTSQDTLFLVRKCIYGHEITWLTNDHSSFCAISMQDGEHKYLPVVEILVGLGVFPPLPYTNIGTTDKAHQSLKEGRNFTASNHKQKPHQKHAARFGSSQPLPRNIIFTYVVTLHNPSVLDPSYSFGKAVLHLHWRNDNSALYQSNTVLRCSFRPNYSSWWNIHPQKCPGFDLTLHIHASAFLLFFHKASLVDLYTRRQVLILEKLNQYKLLWF